MSAVLADDPGSPNWADSTHDLRSQRSAVIAELGKLRDSAVIVYWNLDEMVLDDFFTLADFLETQDGTKDIDLVVVSPGGNGEAGFRIGHAYQHWAHNHNVKFRVIVPLYAKSAATILALGADEIVMGLHSEIGPIDPQIPKIDKSGERWRYVPAMAIMDGLKLIGEYTKALPGMDRFFQDLLLNERISLDDLGMIERSRESGKQYGQQLLTQGMITKVEDARACVERLSDFYKFHGHPIDAFEAAENLGLNIAHSAGEEWALIKALRDEFQKFVGQPDVIPGMMVTSVVESQQARTWRQVPVDPVRPGMSRQNQPETWSLRR